MLVVIIVYIVSVVVVYRVSMYRRRLQKAVISHSTEDSTCRKPG